MEAVIGYPPEHRQRTRARILECANRLFKARGYDGVSIDAVMAAAGLTRGGFYLHFASKKALFAVAVAESPPPAISRAALAPDTGVEDIIAAYLDARHRDGVADGCPMAALTAEMARAQGPARAAYTRNIARFRDAFAKRLPGALAGREERALALVVQCIGGLMLARAVADPALSDEILEAARAAARELAGRHGGARSGQSPRHDR